MYSDKTILYSSCLMLEIANADGYIAKNEINIIKEIIIDFFSISEKKTLSIIELSHQEIDKSIDIFHYSVFLNKKLDYNERLDLVKCIFEVGYSDGKLHYLEYHYIKTIANLLNIERKDLINAKIEIKEN